MAENGFGEEDYQESLTLLDVPATILEAILNTDLDGRVQEEELEGHLDDGSVSPIARQKLRLI